MICFYLLGCILYSHPSSHVERKGNLVRLEGIEPTTFGLRIRCSAS